MQLNKQKIAQLLFFWIALVVVSPLMAAAKGDIIYEYETITQKKGQSFEETLKQAHLSYYQKQLMMDLPVTRAAKSDRKFRIIFAVGKGKRLIREVKVTRGNRMVNFVLEGKAGRHQFVSHPTNIPRKLLKPAKQSKTASKSAKLIKTDSPLFALRVAQKKGQKLDDVLRPLKLSKLQRQIVKSGDFMKSALSTRYFTLYFAGNKQQKFLRGLEVTRGKRSVLYGVEKNGDNYKLLNLKMMSATKRNAIQARFSRVKVTKLASAVASSKSSSASKSSKPSKASKASTRRVSRNVTTSGNYMLVRLVQGKGKSLASAMQGFALTGAQRDLINKIPVTAKAKSTRYFYLLFERKGSSKYLKAVRVVRGKSVAEFVLAKYRGKWQWANKRGKVTASGGFLRYPLNFKRISSPFNLRRRHPITRRIRPHEGTDFAAPVGTRIWAPADGVVTFAGRQRGYGITLEISHGNGYKTKYGHLSRILVRKGQRVKKRQTVARVGNTGRSTGPHLHYEVRVNGRPRNPMTVRLPGGGGSMTLSSAKKAAAKYLPQIRRML